MVEKYLPDKDVWWENNQLCVPLYQYPGEPKDYLGTGGIWSLGCNGSFPCLYFMWIFRILVYCKLVKCLAIWVFIWCQFNSLLQVKSSTPKAVPTASETQLITLSLFAEATKTSHLPVVMERSETAYQKDVRFSPSQLFIFCAGNLSFRKDGIKPIFRYIRWFTVSISQNHDQYSHVFSTVFSHKYLSSKKEITL